MSFRLRSRSVLTLFLLPTIVSPYKHPSQYVATSLNIEMIYNGGQGYELPPATPLGTVIEGLLVYKDAFVRSSFDVRGSG